MAVARLGYEIDSSGAVVASRNLDDMTASAKRAEVGSVALTSSANRLGAASRTSAAHIGNITAQLNDIGVVLAAGQNPLTIALQQGTQLNQVFAQLGGGRAALAAVGQGFLSLINPVSLATIGIIAASTAVAQLGISAIGVGSDAKTFEEQLDDLTEAVETYRKSVSDAESSTAKLAEEYGVASSELRLVLGDFAALARIDVARQIDDATQALNEFVTANSFLERAGGGALRPFVRAMEFVTGEINTLDRDLVQIGRRFANNLDILENSSDQSERLRAALDLRQTLLDNAGGHEGLNEEQREFLNNLGQIIREMEIFRGAVEDLENGIENAGSQTVVWANRMASVGDEIQAIIGQLGEIGGGLLTNAARQVEIDALRAGRSIADARREAESFRQETEFDVRAAAATNIFERATIAAERAIFERGQLLDRELQQERDAARERERASGAAQPFDIGVGDIESTIESLRTQTEVVQQWYAQSEEALRLASDQQLEIIGGRQEAERRLEIEHQERLAQIRGSFEGTRLGDLNDFFGQAAGLMQSGNDKLFRIGKAFAIANAIVDGISAAQSAWAHGMAAGGPPLAAAYTALSLAQTGSRIAALRAASAGGGATGAGGVSASGITAESTQQAPQQTRAIIQIQANGRTRFTVEEISDIITGIQDQSDDGVIIEGITT